MRCSRQSVHKVHRRSRLQPQPPRVQKALRCLQRVPEGGVTGKARAKSEKPEIITDIQSTGKLEENNEKLLAQIIEEYKKGKK